MMLSYTRIPRHAASARQCAPTSASLAPVSGLQRRVRARCSPPQALKWPFGQEPKSDEATGDAGKPEDGLISTLLRSAPRQPRRRGCQLAPAEAPQGLKLATFAGGCFWGLELAFQRVPGVVKTCVGYTAGTQANPTYEEVCMGITGHTEAVQVTYNPDEVSFATLMDVFLEKTDVTTLNRQGGDRGTQYRSGVYTHDDEQRAVAAAKFQEVNEKLSQGPGGLLKRKVVAELQPASDFYVAEEYHQQYLAKGGRFGMPQRADKGCKDPIRCYG